MRSVDAYANIRYRQRPDEAVGSADHFGRLVREGRIQSSGRPDAA